MPHINTQPEHSEHPTAASGHGLLPTAATFRRFFNGTFSESFDALVTSDGATVSMSLERSGGGDLTMNFDNGHSIFDCTPAATITLTAGTDAVPVANYVYILASDKILTVSTTDWPDAEHIRVGLFHVPSATWVNTNSGVYGNNNVNNEHSDTATGQGHLAHIGDWMRHRGAQWHSGCALTITESDPDLFVVIAAGTIAQVHHHTFAAIDTEAAGMILVVNEPGDNWMDITSLDELTQDSAGVALGLNKWYKVFIFGIANKSGELSPVGLLLPSGTYNSQADALADVDKKATTLMPESLTLEAPLAFPIAFVVVQHQAAKTVFGEIVDLRNPNSLTSGGGGGAGNVLGPASSTDNAIARWDAATGRLLQDSGITVDDSDNPTFPANIKLSGDILNQTGQFLLDFVNVGTGAVNYFQLSNHTAGNDPVLAVTGSDTDVGMDLNVKGAGEINLNAPVLIDGSDKLQLRDSAIFIQSLSDGNLLIQADTLVTIGLAGHIDLGDGTLRQLRPQTDAKIDLGSASKQFNDGFLAGILKATGGVRTAYDATDLASPPTTANLDTIWTGADTVGAGWLGIYHDNAADGSFYVVGSDGTNWFHSAAFTKAS